MTLPFAPTSPFRSRGVLLAVASRLVELLEGRMPGPLLRSAEDSVGATDAICAQVAGVTAAMEDAFMSGLSTACVSIGLLCIAGALFSLPALPGHRFVPPHLRDPA